MNDCKISAVSRAIEEILYSRLAKRKEDDALAALDEKMKAMMEKGDATLQKTMAR